jgi:hypothetical protein
MTCGAVRFMRGAMSTCASRPVGQARVRTWGRQYRSPCKCKNHSYRSDNFFHYLFLSKPSFIFGVMQ